MRSRGQGRPHWAIPLEDGTTQLIARLSDPRLRQNVDATVEQNVRVAPLLTFALVGGICSIILAAAAAFPGLAAISPRAPSLVEVKGAVTTVVGPGQVRYQRSGDSGSVMLFLHGFNNQLASWEASWPQVTACGQAIRIDIPGYGGSTWPTTSYALPDQGQRVIDFLDAQGVARVTLIGSSMGGSLAAWIAAKYPERVGALMLMAPSGFPGALTYGGRYRPLYRAGWANDLATRIAASTLYRSRYPASRALQALTVTASYGAPWAAALPMIQAPTLVVWSRGDPAVPFAYADSVTRAIPKAVLLPVAADVGHLLNERRAELIGALACALNQGASPADAVEAVRPLLAREGDL